MRVLSLQCRVKVTVLVLSLQCRVKVTVRVLSLQCRVKVTVGVLSLQCAPQSLIPPPAVYTQPCSLYWVVVGTLVKPGANPNRAPEAARGAAALGSLVCLTRSVSFTRTGAK